MVARALTPHGCRHLAGQATTMLRHLGYYSYRRGRRHSDTPLVDHARVAMGGSGAAGRYHNAGSLSAATQRDGPASGVIARSVNDCPSQPSGRFSLKGAGANASVIGAKPTLA